jgi:hypothetical protein
VFERLAFGGIVGLGRRLDPMDERVLEQVADQLPLRSGAPSASPMFREERNADLYARPVGRPRAGHGAPGDDPREGSIRRGYPQKGGVGAQQSVLLPPATTGMSIREPEPLVFP